MGGLSLVLFGLISRRWPAGSGVENRVRFLKPTKNPIAVRDALTAGAGDLTLKFGNFTMGRYSAPRRSVRSSSIKSSAGAKQRIRFCARQRRKKDQRLAAQPLCSRRDKLWCNHVSRIRHRNRKTRLRRNLAIGEPKPGLETVTSSRLLRASTLKRRRRSTPAAI